MPCRAISAAISSQSRRRYASPPISVISRVPAAASCRTTSRHSAVDSSSARRLPAREPQWLHFRLQASVISQTTWTGTCMRRSLAVRSRSDRFARFASVTGVTMDAASFFLLLGAALARLDFLVELLQGALEIALGGKQ